MVTATGAFGQGPERWRCSGKRWLQNAPHDPLGAIISVAREYRGTFAGACTVNSPQRARSWHHSLFTSPSGELQRWLTLFISKSSMSVLLSLKTLADDRLPEF